MRKSYLLAVVIFLAGCSGFSPDQIDPCKITSINIIDHNGMSETINAKERLNAFENTDFLSPQPYQKVLRVYGRKKKWRRSILHHKLSSKWSSEAIFGSY